MQTSPQDHARALRVELAGLLALAGVSTEAIATELGLSTSSARALARQAFADTEPPEPSVAADRIEQIRRLRRVAAFDSPTTRMLAMRPAAQEQAR